MIKPLHDNIVVERVSPPDKSPGGIVLTDQSKDDLQSEFFVVAIGPGKRSGYGKRVSIDDIKVKDIVIANTYAGKEVIHGVRKFRIIPYDAVLGKVEPTKVVAQPVVELQEA